MFPVGAAGVGLLILRVCAAGMLVRIALTNSVLMLPTWEIAGLIILAVSFCLGALTPMTCIVSGFAQGAFLFCRPGLDGFSFAFSLAVTAAVFLIGPGAYSIDSHLFGRRLIIRSTSK